MRLRRLAVLLMALVPALAGCGVGSAAGPLRVVNDAGLRRRTSDEGEAPDGRLAGEVRVRPDPVGAQRVQDVPPEMAVRLTARPGSDPPGVLSRRIGETQPQGMNERRETATAGGPVLGQGVGRREDPHRVAPPERADHGRRVVEVPPRDQVLQQWEPRVIERQIG